MDQLKTIILCITISFFTNCTEKAPEKNIQKESILKEQNFDNIIKCSDYTYDEGYFVTADYGCIYKQNGNNYGNITLYLIPKRRLNLKDEQVESENNRVNGLSIARLKKEFKIVLFLIDYKYLNYNKSGDPMYYQNKDYQQKAYVYDDEQDKWILIDSINISNKNSKEQTWLKNILYQQLHDNVKNENHNKIDVLKIIQIKETENFSLIKKQICDLNKDGLEDYVLIFKNNEEFNSSNDKTKKSPVIVLINKGDDLYIHYENNNIYPNNFNDLYKNLIVKDSYFTIELFNEDPNNYSSEKYITFKYTPDDILLHRYSEIIYWSNNKTDKVDYTSKNFGSIRFSDFNPNTIVDKNN